MTHPRLMVALASILLSAGSVLAQPPAGEGTRQPPTADEVREILRRHMGEVRRRWNGWEDALRRLDAGEAPEAVLGELDLPSRVKAGDGPIRRRPPGAGEPEPREDLDPRLPEVVDAGPAGEIRAKLTAFLDEHAPDIRTRLGALREESPVMAERVFQRLVPRLRDAMREARRDPALLKARLDEVRSGLDMFDAIESLGRARRQPPGADRDVAILGAREQVRKALGAGFDARLKLQELEVAMLSRRLEVMREGIAAQHREREKRLDEMTAKVEAGKPPDDGAGPGEGGPRPEGDGRPGPRAPRGPGGPGRPPR